MASVADVADMVPAKEDARERMLVVRAAMERVRGKVQTHTYEAAKRTLRGEPTEVVAADLGMTRGAVLTAKCRVLKMLRAELGELLD
jgi:hypothetical protein